MNEQIKQIAERLRGLRDVLELTAEDIARDSDISAEEYRLAETGDYDISVSMLQKIARTYNVALDALMFGEEPKMSSYFVTRAGKGISIERYYIAQRIELVKELLVYNELTISEIAYRLHYSSVAHLSGQFRSVTGLSPTQFKRLKNHPLRPLDEI